MKRVLCIVGSMNAGGAETFLMKVFRSIDRTKYQMDFCINCKEKCYYEDEILSLGGKIFRIPSKSENIKEFTRQLSAVVEHNQYKYVMRVTSSGMGLMDLKIAKKAGASVCVARSSNSSDGETLNAKIMHMLGKVLYSSYVDVKIAPSDLAAMYTFGKKNYEKGNINILHNAVDLSVFNYSEEMRKRIRQELGVQESATLIGHVGRFSNQKNHKFLLDVFFEIQKKDEDAILLLVGKGELEEQIKAQAKELNILDKIIFTGVRSDVPSLLSAMDVFVFPSFYEGMPNTVIEAQATGLPCVIADTITREADITGLVKYLSLEISPEKWADEVFCAKNSARMDVSSIFVEKKYDIQSVAREFEQLIFSEK